MLAISATKAARSLSEILDRVRYRGEEFLIVRNGEEIARLSSVRPATATLGELLAALAAGSRTDPGFADDLEHIQRMQPKLGGDPWAS